MDTYTTLVHTNTARDRIIKLSGYVCTILSTYNPSFSNFASLTSQCRACLRLMDDAVVLKRTIKWASDESDPAIKVFTILSNLSLQTFLPLDHLSLLTNLQIIKTPNRFKTPSLAFLSLALIFNTFKGVRVLMLLLVERRVLLERYEVSLLEGSQSSTSSNQYRDEQALKRCKQQCLKEALLLVKNLLDFFIVSSNLPWRPILWLGTAKPFRNATLGFVSTLCSILALLLPK